MFSKHSRQITYHKVHRSLQCEEPLKCVLTSDVALPDNITGLLQRAKAEGIGVELWDMHLCEPQTLWKISFKPSNSVEAGNSLPATQQPASCCSIVLWRRPIGFALGCSCVAPTAPRAVKRWNSSLHTVLPLKVWIPVRIYMYKSLYSKYESVNIYPDVTRAVTESEYGVCGWRTKR